MPVNPNASLQLTAFAWVPPFAQGQVRDLRVRWACEELGLDYAERLIDVTAKPDSYYREQPWGQVPALNDNGVQMFESGAILLHLAQKSTTLLPTEPKAHARAISWLFAALNSVEPLMFELMNVTVFSRQEEWAQLRKPSLYEFLGGRLQRLSDALGNQDYLEGEFTVGDLAMATVLRIADSTDLVSGIPRLAAYQSRCLARPAFQRALDAQLAVFNNNTPKHG